jgi:hypothetical protein
MMHKISEQDGLADVARAAGWANLANLAKEASVD